MMNNNSQDETGSAASGFIAHLIELRGRVLRMAVAIGLLFVILFPFADRLYTIVAQPLLRQLPQGSQMIATDVVSPLLVPFKMTLLLALFIAVPYLLYQVWAFIAPGLYRHERRLLLPILLSSSCLFYLGVAFAYFVVFPLVFGFMVAITPAGVSMMTDIGRYWDFVLAAFLVFGVVFEIPVATFLLVMAGLVTPAQLSAWRPYIIVGAFVLGMLLTPPDVISQILLAFPMWVLYEAGIIFSRLFLRRRLAAD